MSDAPQGPGWWQATDGKYYPPERHPQYRQSLPPPPAQAQQPRAGGGHMAPKTPRSQPSAPLVMPAGSAQMGGPPKESHRGRTILIVVGAVVLLIVIAAVANGNKKAVTTTDTTLAPVTTAAPDPAAAAATTVITKPTPVTAAAPIFQMSGSGDQDTGSFHVPNEWQVDWTYNCATFGQSGNFEVSISQPPGKVGINVEANDDPINQLGMSGSGIQSYHYGGTVFLSVLSECDWTLKVP